MSVLLEHWLCSTDVDGIALGAEVNFSVAKNVNKNLSLMLKGAVYEADTDGLCCTNGNVLSNSVECCDDDLSPSEISHHQLANLQCRLEISRLADALDRQRDVLAW